MSIDIATDDIRAIGPACTLGEGPLWHPERGNLFLFDIDAGHLFELGPDGGQERRFEFGEPASACCWADRDTLLVATASGLARLDLTSGERTTLAAMEAENAATRSNDGRAGPNGFWIGTMGRDHGRGAGAYYRFANGRLETLFENVTIPNATCFSPDGRTAYLGDTARQTIWKWPLDETGAPVGERQVHIDLRGTDSNPDGAVCDAEGALWCAHWGTGRLVRYDPDGQEMGRLALPVSQPTCPAFGGENLETLYVTSARRDLSDSQLREEPDAGRTLVMPAPVRGLPERRAAL